VNFNDYQDRAHSTSKGTEIGGDTLIYPLMGLAGEVGELLNKVKKLHRDGDGDITDAQCSGLVKECGDCLWYLAEVCTQLGVDLDYVAHCNLQKIADRAARGAVGGSGDER